MDKWACLCKAKFDSKLERDKHVYDENQFVNRDPDDVHAASEDFSQPERND